ncbi:MAG: DUF99 family protein [Thermoplasmata archaeon]|nr:DUF99 family protein [Thermoplasmata archaeon]
MKNQIRAIGIDDSPFKRYNKRTHIIGTIMRYANYIEGISIENIKVDGNDSTEKILKILKGKFNKQIKIIFLSGITFAGFNIVDIESIYDEMKIPVITVTRKNPNFEKIYSALKKYFDDYEKRYELMTKYKIYRMDFENYKIYSQFVGIDLKDAKNIIKKFTIRGNIPEPIRISHMVGSAIKFGCSKGKA